MKFNTIALWIALLAVALSTLASAQETSESIDLELAMDTFVSSVRQALPTAGMTVTIVMDGAVVYSKGFGERTIGAEEVTTSSLFHTASVSKPFVATAIAMLCIEGKLDLQDKVVDHLPYFIMDDPSYQDITIDQLARHISGMPDVQDYQWDTPQTDDEALERWVRSLKDRSLLADPGAELHYSNIGFEILGDVIAKVSGMSFEEYVHTQILKPAGMINSTFFRSEVPENLATSPHVVSEGKLNVSSTYPYNRRHAPSSTLHSNGDDMARWMLLNISRGEIHGEQVLPRSVFDMLFETPYEQFGTAGLSWFIPQLGSGKDVVMHEGRDIGYRSIVLMLPEDSFGVTILCNSDNVPVLDIARAAYAASMGMDPGTYSPESN